MQSNIFVCQANYTKYSKTLLKKIVYYLINCLSFLLFSFTDEIGFYRNINLKMIKAIIIVL